MSSTRGQSVIRSDSAGSLSARCKPGTVEREIVTLMFNSMLGSIIESWDVIPPPKTDDPAQSMAIPKTASELTVTSKKKKAAVTTVKQSKTRRSRSKLDVLEGQDQPPVSWFAPPDERAIIRFRNGNLYEGNISMKCMHGEGRFQWTDGTVYLGKFKDNEIKGQGKIFWKDDTWYEGEFVDNLRHGHGLYVDSRKQRMYCGGWHCGTKHGEGVIYYSKTFKNSYSGEWINNVRHGFGSREYCPSSGYKGEWNAYVREGKGLMIWPNHDFYRGEWKNGVMSGYGIYIWDAYYNNSMSLPSVNAFRGNWDKGQRNGYGVLNLGFGLGSHYKGEFKNNKKNGAGKFVTNNGFIIQHKNLFIDDNMGPMISDKSYAALEDQKQVPLLEPYKFDICDETVGLIYHIEEAFNNIDRQHEIRANILSDYLEINKPMEIETSHMSYVARKTRPSETQAGEIKNLKDLIEFEEESLRKALRCYETELKRIYYTYATICNTEEINFKPILIRLYLWQLYFDCNIHEKGLTLVDIDMMFFENPEWLARSPHNPFEKIYFWQFIHSLLTVANRLYAQKQLPGPKPDTILASGFRKFMEKDVLVGAGRCRGRLAKGYASFIPLKALYNLYRRLGEPHTLRQFLQAIRFPPHCLEYPQPELLEPFEDALTLGRNAYIYGDDMTFITGENVSLQETNLSSDYAGLLLFNFANLSSKAIVIIFSRIFPGVVTKTKKRIKNLETNMTFYEFFEAFVACAEESIRVKEEELRWREKFASEIINT
ncbi:radial spoke head 10 homolog B-like isoform X2 [Plodia interpunctella]|nr:radial spoke head 10 homolog B-like isoform X2 [Plodia interpunctella]